MSEIYRKAIAVIVINELGEILICERSERIGAWQLPQGGIDEGEDMLEALKRELFEEIGLTDFKVIFQLPHKIRYDFPAGFKFENFKGQEHTYFVVQVRADYKFKFDFEPIEFRAAKWVSREYFENSVQGFKREAYIQALEELKKYFPDLIKENANDD